jgi:hypothetical protein
MLPATVLLAALALSPVADLQTLSGKQVSGELVGLDKQAAVIRTAGGERVRVPVTDLLQITLPPADPPPRGAHTAVELTDGSVLLCSAVAIKGNAAEMTVIPDTNVTVPLTGVFTILRDAHDPKIRQEWQDFLSKRGRLDMVVVRSDDRLNGLEGTFGAGTGDAIEFTANGTNQKRSIRLARAQGMIFVQKPDPNAPPPLCKVGDTVGNLLVAAEVALSSEGMTVATVSGARVTLPDVKRLAKLDFSKGKLAYLSDLTPSRESTTLTTEEDDQYARFVRYRKDLNLENQPIKLGGKQYPKGLSLHAGTQLVYPIGGEYKEFRALLGVDEGVTTESPVEVLIEGDGRELYHGQTARRAPAKLLALDVRGVRDLRITVRAPGLLDLGDQVSLADAKVSK